MQIAGRVYRHVIFVCYHFEVLVLKMGGDVDCHFIRVYYSFYILVAKPLIRVNEKNMVVNKNEKLMMESKDTWRMPYLTVGFSHENRKLRRSSYLGVYYSFYILVSKLLIQENDKNIVVTKNSLINEKRMVKSKDVWRMLCLIVRFGYENRR